MYMTNYQTGKDAMSQNAQNACVLGRRVGRVVGWTSGQKFESQKKAVGQGVIK